MTAFDYLVSEGYSWRELWHYMSPLETLKILAIKIRRQKEMNSQLKTGEHKKKSMSFDAFVRNAVSPDIARQKIQEETRTFRTEMAINKWQEMRHGRRA